MRAVSWQDAGTLPQCTAKQQLLVLQGLRHLIETSAPPPPLLPHSERSSEEQDELQQLLSQLKI